MLVTMVRLKRKPHGSPDGRSSLEFDWEADFFTYGRSVVFPPINRLIPALRPAVCEKCASPVSRRVTTKCMSHYYRF
jgi:hypothetical protein